jgi:SpoIIAA-like
MPVQVHHETANILRVEIRGVLRQPELERCQQEVLDEASRTGTVRLLFVLDAFEGWDQRDNWRDMSFYVRHGDVIERIAIVGDERWRSEALMFAGADLRRAPVEYFEGSSSDDGAARAWLTA